MLQRIVTVAAGFLVFAAAVAWRVWRGKMRRPDGLELALFALFAVWVLGAVAISGQ